MKQVILHHCPQCSHVCISTLSKNVGCELLRGYLIGYYDAENHYHPYNWDLNDLPNQCPFILEYTLQ